MKSPGISVAGIARLGAALFIARRKPGGSLGGKWEFPGGKAEDGESPEEALIREFAEELSLPIRVGEEIGSAFFEHNGIKRTLRAYRIYFDSDTVTEKLVLIDHEEWKWAQVEEIETLDFAPSDLQILPALKTYLASNPRIKSLESAAGKIT